MYTVQKSNKFAESQRLLTYLTSNFIHQPIVTASKLFRPLQYINLLYLMQTMSKSFLTWYQVRGNSINDPI